MSEKRLMVRIPQVCETLYTELNTTPFYKTETGYQFAAYLLSETETPTMVKEFLEKDDYFGCYGITDNVGNEIKELLQTVLDQLSQIAVSDADYTQWITSKKAVGGVAAYHQTMETFMEGLFKIQIKTDCLSIFHAYRKPTEEEKEGSVDDYGRRTMIKENSQIGTFTGTVIESIDLAKEHEKMAINRKQGQGDNNTVLNHRNPFADISIKEQQFLFGSDYGQFEALGLATNHTLTMVPKTTEQSSLILQPGFKIRKMKDLERSKENLVLFDDTLSTEVAQSDNNIYVYIS